MKRLFKVSIILIVLVLSGCIQKNYKVYEINHTFSNDNGEIIEPFTVTISSRSEFEEFRNQNMFIDEDLEDYSNLESSFDEEYFLKNSIIAVVYRARSGNVEEVRIKSVCVESGTLYINVEQLPEQTESTTDMGALFMFYISIEKNSFEYQDVQVRLFE